jgi:hypothetical protein
MKIAFFVILVLWVPLYSAEPGDWLDSSPALWNRPRRAVGKAPKVDWDEIPEMCRSEPRSPRTREERAVVRAGWLLILSHQIRDVMVVTGAADLDGMCRPNEYQDFVFVNGKYAGTLSPKTMGARSDGSSVKVSFPSKREILAEFDRYRREDPLCCPSRISEARYEISEEEGKPVVILKSVRTRPA